MAITLSEGILYTNPVPPQQWERKLVSGVTYADWGSTGEIDVFFAATPELDSTFKYNKYFWITGQLWFHNGTDYIEVAPGATVNTLQSIDYELITSGAYIVNIGVTDATFVMMQQLTQAYNTGNGITLSASGDLDATSIGGFADAGTIITVFFKK